MFKKLSDCCSGLKLTIVAGAFLVLSLALLIVRNVTELNISKFLDPAWVTILISGYPLVYLAVSRLVRQHWVSSALLISVAMLASVAIGEIFAAGEVAFIMAIGAILEDKTTNRAKKGIQLLIGLSPRTGRMIYEKNGVTEEKIIPAEDIKAGTLLRVLAGETIPVDGTIVAGTTAVDQSVLTGESLPVDKNEGDEVFGGTVNCYGPIDIQATEVGENSSLQKMIRLLKEAESKKAPMQRIADKWATWLVPVAVLLAVITAIITFVLQKNFNTALVRGVTILVVFCPCALALATPTAVMAGIGQAAKHGVLIKSGEALEAMGKATCIAFDKTGTLTSGELTVSDVVSFGDLTNSELLALAAAIEKRSEHPLGKAIVSYASAQNIVAADADGFSMNAGKGVSGIVNGKQYFCGSRRYLEENRISFTAEQNRTLDSLRSEGKALILIADERQTVGAIALADTLRPSAKETVRKLNKLGYETVLLTGDHREAAEYFAKLSGISDVKAELLPEDKVNAVISLQKQGYSVCMIGDGVNDAPALKTANIGVAMSRAGSDIATEAAGISLIGDDIEKMPYLCILTRAALKTIKFGIALSMTINFIAILLSAFGLLTPITGAIVHNAGSVFVVLIAALLYDRKFIKTEKRL